MDTRAKFLNASEIRRDGRPLKLIIGYFDPLWASHVERLKELCTPGEQIVVAVAERPDSLLPVRARAELVAALKSVDYVILFDESVTRVLRPQTVCDERAADMGRAADLSNHVALRHRST